MKRGFVVRLAEKLVQGFLGLSQRGSKLVHHAAHGLAVADPAVQILHPGFQRFGLATADDMLQALCQPLAAAAHLRLRGVHVFVGRFQIQHRRGNLHGDRCGWGFARADRGINRPCQSPRKLAVFRMQLEHGVAHRAKLVGHDLEPVGVPTGKGRPGLGGAGNALARLHQHGGIKTPKLGRHVVKRPGCVERIGMPHGRQHRRVGGAFRLRLGTKEQQILRQAVRHQRLAARQRGVLQQDAGRGTFCVDIGRAQAFAGGLKKRRTDFPKHALVERRMPRRKRQ